MMRAPKAIRSIPTLVGVLSILTLVGASIGMAAPSSPDWVEVGQVTGNRALVLARVYVDRPSLVGSNGSDEPSAWVLYSWNDAQSAGGNPAVRYRSSVQVQVFDCAARRFAIRRYALHPEAMGGGEPIVQRRVPEAEIEYIAVDRDSIGAVVLDAVCRANEKPTPTPAPAPAPAPEKRAPKSETI